MIRTGTTAFTFLLDRRKRCRRGGYRNRRIRCSETGRQRRLSRWQCGRLTNWWQRSGGWSPRARGRSRCGRNRRRNKRSRRSGLRRCSDRRSGRRHKTCFTACSDKRWRTTTGGGCCLPTHHHHRLGHTFTGDERKRRVSGPYPDAETHRTQPSQPVVQ